MGNYLQDTVTATEGVSTYDECAKALLKDKEILAFILLHATKEFAGCSLEEARSAIEGEPELCRPIRPGSAGVARKHAKPDAVAGDNTESNIPGNGVLHFDIVFHAITCDQEQIKIYVNLEIQKKASTGYDLVSRGVVYAARLLSGQLDTEFSTDDYAAKKVYSIWIYPYPSMKDNMVNSITEYSLEPHRIFGNYQGDVNYDLLSVTVIGLQRGRKDSENDLIDALTALLSDELRPSEKYAKLSSHGISVSQDAIKEVENMYGLGQALVDKTEARLREEYETRLIRADAIILEEKKRAEEEKKRAEEEKKRAEEEKKRAEALEAELKSLREQIANNPKKMV